MSVVIMSIVKVHVLCPLSYKFGIIHKKERLCFEGVWEVVREKGKQE